MGCCVVSCTTSHWWWHCVLVRLLIVCLGAHSWQCPLARSLLACVRVRSLMASCPLSRSLVASCARALVLALACTWHRMRARQWQHSVVVALIALHVTCKRSMWNNEIIVCLLWYHTIISCMRTKIKQNSDVFLDLFWLIFCLPKTLVLFLHTTKVPEATRGKSAPNKQAIVYNTTKKVLSVSIFVFRYQMTFRMRCPFSDPWGHYFAMLTSRPPGFSDVVAHGFCMSVPLRG